MLRKMASCDVMGENPSVLLCSLWSAVFLSPHAFFVLIQTFQNRSPAHHSGFLRCLISSTRTSVHPLHLSAVFILGVCGFLIRQPAGSPYHPPVKCEECKWLMWVRVVFMAKREQMLSEMLWWFPPHVQAAHPPLLLTQPSIIPAQAVCLTSSRWDAHSKSQKGFIAQHQIQMIYGWTSALSGEM